MADSTPPQPCDFLWGLLVLMAQMGKLRPGKSMGTVQGTGLGTPRTVLFPLLPTGASASVSLTEGLGALPQHSEEAGGALWAAELFPSMTLTRKVLRGVCGEARSHVLAWLCSPAHSCMCVCA